jgi:hypothetical protein
MRKLLVTCSLLLLASLNVMAQDHSTPLNVPKDTWVKFSSPAGRFSVMLPVNPQEKVEQGSSTYGPHTLHMFTANGDNNSLFMLAWVEYPANFNFNPKLELEANRDNFVKTLKATVLNSRHTTIGGFQSLEFAAETERFDIKSRVFIVGKRPYQIVYASQKGLPAQGDLDRFFESFAVRER